MRVVVRVLLAPLLGALLAGCVSLPHDGPIVQTESTERGVDPGPMFIDARPPRPGDSESAIVKGFLDAMLATPVQTAVARQFLADDVSASWDPGHETITYDTASLPRGSSRVTVSLTGASRLDARGAWGGRLDEGADTLSFLMVKEDGEFRIADPPDALIVPEAWFQQRYGQVSLYFFDPTGSILVPDPVFVQRGPELAANLVDGLAAGPGAALAPFSLSLVPEQVDGDLGVSVDDAGVADVQLTGDGSGPGLSAGGTQALVAQLAWTLRQDPAVERMRVSLDGTPVALEDGTTEFDVDDSSQYAPYEADSPTVLFGIRAGLMVSGGATSLEPVGGPFGRSARGIREIAPDLTADRVAAVADDGRSLLVGSVSDPTGRPRVLVKGARDLLAPAWDFSDRLWLVDRGARGAEITYRERGSLRPLTIPGISGQDVRRFLVSRDASRFVAVVRRSNGDHLVASRLLYDAQGRVEKAMPGVVISQDQTAGSRIRDIAWNSPTSLTVLYPLSQASAQVRTATVDGAPVDVDGVLTRLPGDVRSLVGSPVPGESLYAFARGTLVDLTGAVGGDFDIDPTVTDLGYVG